jgi:AcrR family transcriptional regulator
MYYYFRSKEGIYLDLMRKPLEGFLEAIEAAAGKKGCAWDRIVGVCLGAYDYFMRHLPQARIMYSIYYGPPQGAPFIDFDSVQLRFPETILRLVEEGIRGGEFRQGDPADMAWAVTGAVSVAMELELSARGPGIGRSLGSGGIRRMLGVIFDGIAGWAPDTGKGKGMKGKMLIVRRSCSCSPPRRAARKATARGTGAARRQAARTGGDGDGDHGGRGGGDRRRRTLSSRYQAEIKSDYGGIVSKIHGSTGPA